MDRLACPALELELRIERQVERDRQAVLARDRPAFLASALDDHLLGRELMAVDSQAPAVELLELTGLELRAQGTELLAQLRPEQGQVRLDL